MATIVTRAGKGEPLTVTEHDANLTNLNDAIGSSETDVSDLDDRITVNEGEIDTLQTDVDAAEVDIDDLETEAGLNTTHRGVVTGNPHAVTQSDVGLNALTNEAQLVRGAEDYSKFDPKTSIADDDTFLIEDSEDAESKKYITGKMIKYAQTNGFLAGSGAELDSLFTITEAAGKVHLNWIADCTYCVGGKFFTIDDNLEIDITDVHGLHWIYFDNTGTLKIQAPGGSIAALILSNCLVAAVYWEATGNSVLRLLDERHGADMSPATHYHLHETLGAMWEQGFTPAALDVDGSGTDASHAQFDISAGEYHDEDIEHSYGGEVNAWVHTFFRQGSGGPWFQMSASNGFPLAGGVIGDRLDWNDYNGGAWQLQEVGNNQFVLSHYFALGDEILCIMGQATHISVVAARSAASTEMNSLITDGLPMPEMVPLFSILWQTNDGYSNALAARIRSVDDGEYIDWRGEDLVSFAGSTIVDTIQFNTDFANGNAEGRLQWNAEDGTLEYGLPGGNVNLQIGQEHVLRCANASGDDIADGSVVYVSGVSGNRPTIELADADPTDSIPEAVVLGMTTELISNNGTGYVTLLGLVRDVDTDGMTPGTMLWLSVTPGEYTETKPTAPNRSIAIGLVIVAHADTGIIFVNTTVIAPVMASPDVLAGAPADGQVLQFVNSNGRFELSDDVASNTAARHAESHAQASHNDTNATGAELEELTGAGETILHYHSMLKDDAEVGALYTKDGAMQLNFNGLKAMVTNISGISIVDTDGAVPYIYFYDDDSNLLAQFRHRTTTLTLGNKVDGGHTEFRGENTASDEVLLIDMDPDAGVILYCEGLQNAQFIPHGVNLRSIDSTDVYLNFESSVGLQQARFKSSAGLFEMKNFHFGGHVYLKATNTGEVEKHILDGDPDAGVVLNFTGLKSFSTRASGIDVYDTAGSDIQIRLNNSADTHRATFKHTGSYVQINDEMDGGAFWMTAKKTDSTVYWVGWSPNTRAFYSSLSKGLDLGRSGTPWDTAYADDFENIADFFFMDDRKDKDGKIVPIDDGAVIEGIVPSGDYDPITGLRIINDSSLPTWLVSKHKHAGEDKDEAGDVVRTWEKGDICRTDDGKPYLSLKTMISLLMGASRQTNGRVKTLEAQIQILDDRRISNEATVQNQMLSMLAKNYALQGRVEELESAKQDKEEKE